MIAQRICSVARAALSTARAELSRRSVIVFTAAIIGLSSAARATTYTWDADANPANGPTDGSGTWDMTGLNWYNAGTDIAWTGSSADIAAFGQGGGAVSGGTVTLGASLGAGGISFNGGDTGSFTISGTGSPTLTLGLNGIVVNAGAGAETFDNNLAISLFTGASWVNNSSNLLTINSDISSAKGGSLNIGGMGNTTINGVLSNGPHLEVTIKGTGTSVVTLSAANTYTGVTNVASGTLRVINTAGSATGTGTVSASGSLQGPSATGQGFISGAVTVTNTGKLLASSGATLTLRGGLTLVNDSSSTFAFSGTPNGAASSPLVATGTGGATSLTVTGTHTINVSPSSTINVPTGMPYALYEAFSYFGTPPSVTSTAFPYTGVFFPGTAPNGFNLGLFEGTSAATTITNNQLDVAVATKPFVYLKTGDASGATSFNGAGNWSNVAAPSSIFNYVVSLNSLRSPAGSTAATFAGNSLTLGAGGSLGIQTTGNGTTTTVPTLVLNGGRVTNSQGSDGSNYTDVLGGTNIFLTSTSAFDTLSGGAGTRNLTVNAPISGPGGLMINPATGSASTVSLTRPNTYTGATTVTAGTFALAATGGLGNTAITVSAIASFSARPGSGSLSIGSTSIPSAGATITLNPGGGAVNGGTFDMLDGAIGTVMLNQGANVPIGLTLGSSGPLNSPVLAFEISDNGTTTAADQLFVTNGVSVGTGTGASISITPIGSNPLHAGTYPLITAGSFTNAAGFSLATPAVSIGSNQYNLSLSNTGTVENLIVSLGGPAVTYWSGAQNNVWNALTPAPGGTNWLDGPAGMDAGTLPSSGTNVFFTANSAANLATKLGADFAINSLTFTGRGTSATSSVTISGNTLTINASAANGNAAGSGIVVQSGSGAHTIASNILLGATQTWTNSSTNPLTISGSISDGGHDFGLTTGGSGAIVFSGNNSYGGTTVCKGTLTTTASGTIGSGSLAVIGDLTPSTVNLGNSQSIGSLSGAVSNGGTARINIAAGVTLNVNQSADAAFPGTIALGTGAAIVKAGGSTLEIGRAPILQDNSSISVGGGKLRFAVSSGSSSIGSGVTATISNSATLELAGSVSSLGTSVASERVHIANTSAAALLVTGTSQQVGAIDGAGTTQVNAGGKLTADHIVQSALIIAGDAIHPATVTIAASDANGNPLAISSGIAHSGSTIIPTTLGSEMLSASNLAVSPGLLSNAGGSGADGTSHAGRESTVPEPSTLLLLAIGAAGVLSKQVRRQTGDLR